MKLYKICEYSTFIGPTLQLNQLRFSKPKPSIAYPAHCLLLSHQGSVPPKGNSESNQQDGQKQNNRESNREWYKTCTHVARYPKDR